MHTTLKTLVLLLLLWLGIRTAVLLLCAAGKQQLSQSRPTPCRSQPSLVQSKLSTASDRSQKKPSAAVSHEKSHSAGSSRASNSKANIPASKTRPKTDATTTSSKRMETVAKSKSKPIVSSKSEETAKRPSGRQTDPLLSSPRSRRRQLADENIDVTTYLLHRMLGAPAQLPDDRTTLVSAGKKPGKDADDKHSEAGTYTIDDEEDEAVKQSIQQARDRIDDVFGIADGMEHKADTASSHLVRPVIEAKHTQQGQSEPSAVKADDDDDDAFVGVDEDDVHQQHYVRILLTEFSFSLLWDYAIMKWIPTFTKIC